MSPSQDTSFSPSLQALNGSAEALWHKSAPAAVRRAFSRGETAEGWAAWNGHLDGRKRPVAVSRLLPGKAGGLDWAVPEGIAKPPTPEWLDSDGPDCEKGLLRWLGESAGGEAAERYALEALACCRALPKLAAVLSPDVWWAALDHLITTAAEAGGSEPDDRPLEENPLLHQLLAGELALTLAYIFPEIDHCRKLKSSARRALSAGLIDLLDGEGLPHAKHFSLLRPLLACWTRCRAIGRRLKGRCWNKSAAAQYEWLVRQALRLTRADGTHVFGSDSSAAWDADLFETALRLGGDEDDQELAVLVLPRAAGTGSKKGGEAALPEPANHSEWACASVLRRRWARSTEQLTVLFDQPSLRVELGCGEDVVLSGAWQFDVRRDGHRLSPDSDWEEVCWISDKDGDYLELQIDLAEGATLERSMFLARKDRFLLLTDAVLCVEPSSIEYGCCLPLRPSVSFQPADESPEGLLLGGKRRANVLPLALPEWRADERIGDLSQTGESLQLRQSGEGGRLFAPLFIDLDGRRRGKKLTWRQLTVAESLEIQPPEVAVGYRVAIGRQQWLIYRSLAKPANRTLLGHNLSSEMLIARFEESGEVEPLLEIE